MGDSRFSLKVEFEIYGQAYKWEPSLNYFDSGDGMDDRIRDWFVHCYKDAVYKSQEEYRKEESARKLAEKETHEKAELQRLKDKYEKPNVKVRGGTLL